MLTFSCLNHPLALAFFDSQVSRNCPVDCRDDSRRTARPVAFRKAVYPGAFSKVILAGMGDGYKRSVVGP